MRISVKCPGCQATLKTSQRNAGSAAVCPKCQTRFQIGQIEDGSADLSDSTESQIALDVRRPGRLNRRVLGTVVLGLVFVFVLSISRPLLGLKWLVVVAGLCWGMVAVGLLAQLTKRVVAQFSLLNSIWEQRLVKFFRDQPSVHGTKSSVDVSKIIGHLAP